MCGGKSSRMKRDKSLLPFKNFNTLSQYQLSKFENSFKKIYISTKDKNKYPFEANYIKDKHDTFAPSEAILSVFEKLKENYIFFISVDTPFFNIKEFQKLYNFIDQGFDAIVATQNKKIHPLCAIYSKKSMKLLQKLHNNGEYKIKNFLEKINTLYVEYSEQNIFINLNYYEDYIKYK